MEFFAIEGYCSFSDHFKASQMLTCKLRLPSLQTGIRQQQNDSVFSSTTVSSHAIRIIICMHNIIILGIQQFFVLNSTALQRLDTGRPLLKISVHILLCNKYSCSHHLSSSQAFIADTSTKTPCKRCFPVQVCEQSINNSHLFWHLLLHLRNLIWCPTYFECTLD